MNQQNHRGEQIMDNRTKGIIATVAAVLLCGCPGFFLCIFGGLAAAGAPVTTEWGGVSNTAPMSSTTAFALLCLGLLFVLIPIAVGFITLRRKAAAPNPAEPTPPAS
jgi:hypothetical protein